VLAARRAFSQGRHRRRDRVHPGWGGLSL